MKKTQIVVDDKTYEKVMNLMKIKMIGQETGKMILEYHELIGKAKINKLSDEELNLLAGHPCGYKDMKEKMEQLLNVPI